MENLIKKQKSRKQKNRGKKHGKQKTTKKDGSNNYLSYHNNVNISVNLKIIDLD